MIPPIPIDPVSVILLLLGYAFIGGSIKYIDQAFDEGVFSKKIALLLAVLSGVIMAYFIAFDSSSAIIFIAIILGVAISRKIDNIAFYIGISVVLIATVVYRYFTNTLTIEWVPIAILTLGGFIDEVGNDMADRNQIRGWIKKFFDDRFMMKVTLAVLVFLGTFHWIYLIAFLVWDGAYTLIAWYSENLIKSQKRANAY